MDMPELLQKALDGAVLSVSEFVDLFHAADPGGVEAVDVNYAKEVFLGRGTDDLDEPLDLGLMEPIYMRLSRVGCELPEGRLPETVERSFLKTLDEWQLQTIGSHVPVLKTKLKRKIYLSQVREFSWAILGGEDQKALHDDFESGPPYKMDHYVSIWDLPMFTHMVRMGLRTRSDEGMEERHFRDGIQVGLLFLEEGMEWDERVFIHKGFTCAREIMNRVAVKIMVDLKSHERGILNLPWQMRRQIIGARDLPPFPSNLVF